jgi:acetyl-CoA C-acetyltransferase
MNMDTKNDVIIAGIGQVPVGEHWQASLRSLGVKAIQAALADSGGLKPGALYAGNMLAANLSRQAHLGVLLADYAGLSGIEAETVEAGAASGAAALRQACLAVRSGYVDTAIVVGLEKFTDVVGPEIEAALGTGFDADYEAVHGLTPAAQAALLARRYMHQHGMPADGLAGFALTAHANGAGNKNAMYRKAISLEAYQKAEPVSDPLNLYDLAPNADGAAALVLTRRENLAKEFPHPLVRVAASAAASDALALAERRDPLQFEAVRISTEQALEKAGLQREQVDLFELHDSSSIFAALILEAAGYAKPGAGWKLARDESIALSGQIPCLTMGGSKARGNPGGATGVYQAVEAALQLRGSAGTNQIANARTALVQSIGGPAATAVTHVLVREE